MLLVLGADRLGQLFAALAGLELLLDEAAEVIDGAMLADRALGRVERVVGLTGGDVALLRGAERGADLLLGHALLAQFYGHVR